MKRKRLFLGQSTITFVIVCILSVAGIAHGETTPSPLTFHFLLIHNDGNVQCESDGSPGYNSSAAGRTHIEKQSLLCVFLIGPEKDQPLPTFCSLMGLDENMSCEVRRSGEFWAVSLSSEAHPVGGACSVICQSP